ncbi:MAG: hypothetical protein OEL80_01480, partial [Desulfuromonadales bacterium]|nr:hypothetical protein [Desulfuromonadales bacterium]
QADVLAGKFAGDQCEAMNRRLRKTLKRLSDQVGFFLNRGKEGNHKVRDEGRGTRNAGNHPRSASRGSD